MGISLSKAIIFDFDGTLVDSEKTIYQCFQSITKEIAPDRIGYAKNILIGPPLRDTVAEILGPINQSKYDQFIKLFIKMHDNKVIQHTKPYKGVSELLSILSNKKIPLAIATNKRKQPTIKLIKHFKWENHFMTIECIDSQTKLRNKDDMIKDIINHDNNFKSCYFVGDTINDGLSANLNKLKFIRAEYGYGQNQDWSKIKVIQSIKSFLELQLFI